MAQDAPQKKLEYGTTAFWDDRYENDHEQFDWCVFLLQYAYVASSRAATRSSRYQRYSGLASVIGAHAKKENDILLLGCGNSRMAEDMSNDGASDTELQSPEHGL